MQSFNEIAASLIISREKRLCLMISISARLFDEKMICDEDIFRCFGKGKTFDEIKFTW